MRPVSIPPSPRARRGRSRVAVAGVVAGAVTLLCGLGAVGCSADDGGDAAATSAASVAQWQADGAKILANAPCGTNPATCKGAKLPTARLVDFNPTSATFKQRKSLAELSDKPKVVALLAAW